jgi:hypothetical protein
MKNTNIKISEIIRIIVRLFIGLLFVFIIHLPKLLMSLLEASYYKIFKNHRNLTANPKEHIKRAKKLLKTNRNDLLLYAALEIRFAVERMLTSELILAEGVSNKMLKEYSPVKKRSNLSILDPAFDNNHVIEYQNDKTGEKILWGNYFAIDKGKIKIMHGKLGDLLHPKIGLKLGVHNDPWYIETKRFLNESVAYLNRFEKSEKYFAFKGMKGFNMIKTDKGII